MAGNRGRGPRRPRSKAGQAVLLAFATIVIGVITAVMFRLLARTCAYLGLDAVLPVAVGTAAAIVVPWGYARGARRDVTARWPMLLLVGYTCALVGGMRYYLGLKFHHAGPRPLGLPPLAFQAQLAGLAAEVLTWAASDLLGGGTLAPGKRIRPGDELLAEVVKIAEPGAHLDVAADLYGQELAAIQLVYADEHGHWPWDRRFRDGQGGQPVLGARAKQTA